VSSRVRQGGTLPRNAVRTDPPDAAFSGWVVSGPDEPAWLATDLAGFEPVSHQELTERFRSFDSVEDEPPGTAWKWDEAELEVGPSCATTGGTRHLTPRATSTRPRAEDEAARPSRDGPLSIVSAGSWARAR
jgi:hypothetical protein